MKHFRGRIWTPVFATIDLKKATIKIKDGSVGSPVSIAGGATEWTLSAAADGSYYYTGAGTATKPVFVELDGLDITAQEGTVGSMANVEWGWGDHTGEAPGDTMYMRLLGEVNPDDMDADRLQVSLTETPNEIEVVIGEGNLSYTRARTVEYILDRGNLDDVREGDQVPLDVSLDFQWSYISGLPASNIPTIEEAMSNEGEAAAWNSTDTGQPCRPYAVDIEVTYLPTPSTCGDQEIITFNDFRWESMDHDLRAGTVSVSGKCNILKPTTVRSAQ
jgi:hypothetical protein